MANVMGGSGMSEQCVMPRQMSVRENLQNKKDTLTAALSDVQAALDALDAYPVVSKVLELLAKAGARL